MIESEPSKSLFDNLDRTQSRATKLSDLFFSPFKLYQREGLEAMLYGSMAHKSEQSDAILSKSLRDQLFKGDNEFGKDLLALNVQRGRDHGVLVVSLIRW